MVIKAINIADDLIDCIFSSIIMGSAADFNMKNKVKIIKKK